MREEILKFLADGNSKAAACRKFGISSYKLTKMLKETTENEKEQKDEKDSFSAFLNEFISENVKETAYPLEYAYKVYCGYCISNNIQPGSVRDFISRVLSVCKIKLPSAAYFRDCRFKSDLVLFIKSDKSKKVLDYYASGVTNSILRNEITSIFEDEFDVDCVRLLSSDLDLKTFANKWGSIGYIYYKDMTPVNKEEQKIVEDLVNIIAAAVVEGETLPGAPTLNEAIPEDAECISKAESKATEDNTEKKSVKEPMNVKEPEVFNDATSYVETPLAEKKFTTFKNLRKFFKVVKVCDPTVNAVLCDGRHDVDDIVDDLNAKPIFNSLLPNQMQDSSWMESKANTWINNNIAFDENGIALQTINVYTTGYNPLNMTLIKCALQHKVNITAFYFDPVHKRYWEQKIIDQFPIPKNTISRFVNSGKYYVHDELKGNIAYRAVVDVEGDNIEPYQFISSNKEIVNMLINNLNYEFVKHAYTLTVYRHDQKRVKKIYSCYISDEEI